jgi:hypothetical protein
MNLGIYFANMVCILVIIVLFGVAVIYVETPILETYPPQLSGTGNLTIGQWISSFQKWAILCVVSAGLASLFWYVLAQWVFTINNRGEGAGKRIVWVLLFLAPIIMSIVSSIYVEAAESSLWRAYLLFALNGLLPYYLTTLLFSPLSFKCTPIGAKRIRSVCFW